MQDFVTLVQKGCGHFGLVRDRYNQDSICCSQCELELKDSASVSIMKKRFIEKNEVPELAFEEMDSWIKKQLNSKRAEGSERSE